MKVSPGAFVEYPDPHSAYLILGASGGDLNEKAPFRHVSSEKNSVTLIPVGKPSRLRNDPLHGAEFQLIEIQRYAKRSSLNHEMQQSQKTNISSLRHSLERVSADIC